MEFRTWERAARAAARFELEYGSGSDRYTIERERNGRFSVAVYSCRGTFLGFI